MMSETWAAVMLAAFVIFVFYSLSAASEGYYGDADIFNKEVFMAVFKGHPIRIATVVIIMHCASGHYKITDEELQFVIFPFVLSRIRFSDIEESAVVRASAYDSYIGTYFCKRKITDSQLQEFANYRAKLSRKSLPAAKLFDSEDGIYISIYEKRLIKYLTKEHGIVFEEKILPPPIKK